MKRYISLYSFAIFLLAVLSCCDARDSRLGEIDAIIESDPEQAFAELQQFPTAGMSAADSAYFALLYTQAQIKNFIDVDSDSLISIAYARFKHSGNTDLRRRAMFYKAQVAYYRGNYRAAMQDAIAAYDIAQDERNYYWMAKTSELIADIYFEVYNFKQSAIFASAAANNYLKAEKIRNHRFALCDLATVYENDDRMDKAAFLLDSLQNVVRAEEPLDSVLDRYIAAGQYAILLHNNSLDQLREALPDSLESSSSDLEKIDTSIFRSYTLTGDNALEDASQLLQEAYGLAVEDKDRIRVMYATYKKLKQAGQHSHALELADSMLHLQSNIAGTLLKESVAGVQRDFYSAKAEVQERRSELRLRLLVVFTIVALAFIALLIIIFRLKLRAKKTEIEANLLSLMRLQEHSERLSAENRRMSAEITDTTTTLFRDKWTTLNMLCGEYFDMGDSASDRAAVLNKVEREIIKLRSPQSLHEIEAAVDTYMGRIMTMLRRECPFLSEEDFTFLALVFAGLSSRAVCVLTGMKYKLFYLKKSRLIKKILASDAPHRQLFVDKMK